MSEFRVQGIPAFMVERMWHFAEPYVKRALDHAAGELSSDDLKRECVARNVQLWMVSSGPRVVGAATTEIIVYPQKKHCRVITIAGADFNSWVGMVDKTLAMWAAAMGCDAMEAHVRKGFVKKLAELDYKHLHSVVVKKLDIINPAMEEDHG